MLLRDLALAALVPRMHQDRSRAAFTISNVTVEFYGNFGYGGVYGNFGYGGVYGNFGYGVHGILPANKKQKTQ